VCTKAPETTPTTATITPTVISQTTQYCLDDNVCVYYYIEYSDQCNNNLITNGPYSKIDLAFINTDKWLNRCKEQYNDECKDSCSVKIIQKVGHCCDNICSEAPCPQKETNIQQQIFKWCLYDKYCSDNINSPKQMLMIDKNVECPQHPFNQSIIIEENEQKAIQWLSTDHEC